MAKISKKKIFIHHHSFNYLNDRSFVFLVVSRVAGEKAVHVVLGDKMALRLKSMYGIKNEQIRIVSNASFFKGDVNKNQVGEKKVGEVTIGHLANLSVEKGVDTFGRLCRALDESGVKFKGVIAGPFHDQYSKGLVNALRDEVPGVSYLGPVYGEDKCQFFENIDVFVFPSNYSNEAEPLVLYEAAERGAYLIGTEAGCMRDTISALGGYSSSFVDQKSWVCKAVAHLVEGLDGVSSCQNREKRKKIFYNFKGKADQRLNNMIEEMASAEA